MRNTLYTLNYAKGSLVEALNSTIARRFHYDLAYINLHANKNTLITPYCHTLECCGCNHSIVGKGGSVCLECGAYLDQVGYEKEHNAYYAHINHLLGFNKDVEELIIRTPKLFPESYFMRERSFYNYCRVYSYKNKAVTNEYVIHFVKDISGLKSTPLWRECFSLGTYLVEESDSILLINPEEKDLLSKEEAINIVSDCRLLKLLDREYRRDGKKL